MAEVDRNEIPLVKMKSEQQRHEAGRDSSVRQFSDP